jgi:magnesium-transporting ATPase (P-type)
MFSYVKGAPERILEMCSRQRQGGEQRPRSTRPGGMPGWKPAAGGSPCTGAGLCSDAGGQHELDFADVEGDLTLLALAGIMDPPREEAIRAVAACHGAGIRVKMITGDHAITAAAIAAAMGIGGRAATR